MSVSVEKILADSYANALGLIEFMQSVRTEDNDFSGKYNFRLKNLSGLFSKTVWDSVGGPGGHIVVKHKLTGVIINFSNHKDPVDPGAVEDIAERVQAHLNCLGNDIFQYKGRNWKEVPDFKAVAKRLTS